MKKMEIKNLKVSSVGKVSIYLLSIPALLLLIVGLGMLVIGLISDQKQLVILGVSYAIGLPIVFLILYPLIYMLIALVYNFFANKYGGLEMDVIEKEEIE